MTKVTSRSFTVNRSIPNPNPESTILSKVKEARPLSLDKLFLSTESEDLEFRDILKYLDRESAHFVIKLETHHSGRLVTVVQPHDLIKDSIDLLGLAHKLKQTLGTSGDLENGRIILHGDHRDQAKHELVKLGVLADNIEMI